MHLTGEEFPSDCMGARDFARHLVERHLQLRLENDGRLDLSSTRVGGVFDMDIRKK